MKRIIVEGMDSTGKSTLIGQLLNEFHQLHPVVNELGPDQDFDLWWQNEVDTNRDPFVALHDRFFYSELVYGYHLRGYIKATASTQINISKALRKDALLIFARPSTENIIRTINNKPQMEGVTDRTYRLIQAYDDLMWEEQRHYGHRFIYYDWKRGFGGGTETVERYLLGELP